MMMHHWIERAAGSVTVVMIALGLLAPRAAAEPVVKQTEGIRKIVLLPPGPDNPRNSEGDFIRLKDGRIMFVYTHFTGGGSDHATAHLAARFSADQGRTWTEQDRLILKNEGEMNVMSVSLLRLRDGRIALFYLRKNSRADCHPFMRVSEDEGQTWSEPRRIIPEDERGYYVLNNDRVVQLESGRLVVPVARHNGPSFDGFSSHAKVTCYFSDDRGKTWQRSETVRTGERPDGSRVMLQEPGVVELKDSRLMMWARTDAGSQHVAYSEDRGNTWSRFEPSGMASPVSPASIERIPETGDLLLVWNDHRDISAELRGKRTPFNTAISTDEGQSWQNVKTLEDNPTGWYCYTAIHFTEDGHVLLGHCAGDRSKNNGLNTTQITRFSIDWLYE